MLNMRAVTVETPGPTAALALRSVPRPQRLNDEVLVRVHSAGVDAVGCGASSGIPGLSFSGVVAEAAYDAHPLSVGTPVYGVSMAPRASGSYAEYVAVSVLNVARKPGALSFTEAAAVPLSALTAWGLVVELARAHEGQRMLIHAAGSPVGLLAVQLASYFGAHVIATCDPDEASFMRDLGAAEVIDSPAVPFEEAVAPVDAVVDLVGDTVARTGSRSLGVLRPRGLYANGRAGSFPGMRDAAQAYGVRATDFTVSPDAAKLAILSRLFDAGDLRVRVDRVLPLEEAAEAHRLRESGGIRGELVLSVATETE